MLLMKTLLLRLLLLVLLLLPLLVLLLESLLPLRHGHALHVEDRQLRQRSE